MSIIRSDIRLMLGSLAGVCISNFIIFSSPLYIGSLIDGLGFSETQAGLTNSMEIGAIACTCLLLSQWLSRFSLRHLAMSGALITLSANAATFLSDGYLVIVAVRTLAGIGAGFCLAATSALLSRMSDPDRMVGIMLATNTILMIVALTVMGYAKSEWFFNGVVGLFSIAILVLFPLLFLIPLKSTVPQAHLQTSTGKKDPNFSLGSLGITLLFLFCVIEGCVWAFSERSGTNLGMGDGDIGLLLALAQAAGLVGAILPSVMGEKLPRIYPISIGVLMMGFAGFTIYQTDSSFIYAAALCMFSFGFFVAFPYLLGACARLDKDGRWASRATGINLMGGAMAPFIAASIIEVSNYPMLGNFCLVLSIVCLMMAFSFSARLNRVKPVHAVQQ